MNSVIAGLSALFLASSVPATPQQAMLDISEVAWRCAGLSKDFQLAKLVTEPDPASVKYLYDTRAFIIHVTDGKKCGAVVPATPISDALLHDMPVGSVMAVNGPTQDGAEFLATVMVQADEKEFVFHLIHGWVVISPMTDPPKAPFPEIREPTA